MNREILFRGKRIDNGDWVYDYFERMNGYSYIVNENMRRVREAVIPETVGQYTGFTDKNGVKIFEGDILKFLSGNYVVEWHHDHGKFLQVDRQFSREIFICINESEIIGNIYDNPELLEMNADK